MVVLLSVMLIIVSIKLIIISKKMVDFKGANEWNYIQLSSLRDKYEELHHKYKKDCVNKESNKVGDMVLQVTVSGKKVGQMSICPECGKTGELVSYFYASGIDVGYAFECECRCKWEYRKE